jgi:succinate dehydrogenase / fumarate reductase iron-sulfur subunit
MRMFKDGDTILLNLLAKAFPVIKDLVDRSAFDRIQQAGGFVSINTSKSYRCKCNSNP